MASDVRSIDDLRRLRLAVERLGDRWKAQATDLQRLAERMQQWVAVERRAYWQQQTRLAERRLQASLEALARSRVADASGTTRGGTEARIEAERSKRRLELCRARVTACRKWSQEMDRRVTWFLGELGGLRESADSALPAAAQQLATWIEALDRYSESATPPAPPSGTRGSSPPSDAGSTE